jgi:ubiquinone/menaquinone biosynthesis C-methylase UbiE
MSAGFEGVGGRIAAAVMARRNRAAEAEAVDRLAPSPADAVLVIGFGPGVGLRLLQGRCRKACGVDPSHVMFNTATRLNATAIASGQVQLARTTLASLPWPADSFDGALAVNSLQFWDPLPDSLTELSRVLRPGARLVTLTHDRALERRGPGWLDRLADMCADHDLIGATTWRGRAERGTIAGFEVRRADPG